MQTIRIRRDTFAKQSTASALTLPDDQITPLKAGSAYRVAVVEPISGNHYKVTFADKLEDRQTWVLYGGHFDVEGQPVAKTEDLILPVPYYSQRDNREQWQRTCNTSSCAMVAEYLKPGCINGSDDFYFKHYVQPEGDTTDHAAQTRALSKLGIKSIFYYNLDYDAIHRSLDNRKPVVIGVLHRGTLSNPTGGHMLVIIGRYQGGFWANDPWGAPFAYTNSNGKQVQIPYKSLGGRWLADGPNSGWGRLFA